MRLLLITGFVLTAFSLWQMCNYTLALEQGDIIWPGVIQGFGLGLVFVPLSASTFATPAPDMRAQGTAMYSLIRNIGSSVGIALVPTLLVRNTQIAPESLVTQVNTSAMNEGWLSLFKADPIAALAALNEEVTRQAAMIAYLDDYRLMLILTVLVIPLILLIKPPGAGKAVEVDHAAME